MRFHPPGDAISRIRSRQLSMRDREQLPFDYVVDEKGAHVTSFGGLPLVAEAMTALGVDTSIRTHLRLGKNQRAFDAVALVRATVLLMGAGGDCLDDIEHLRQDDALCELLGGPLPSAGTLRNFLYEFHDEKLIKAAQGEGKARIPKESELLKALQKVLTEHLSAFCGRWRESTATLDIDGTIIESHKKEALPHYQGGRGYQPVVAYWAEASLAVWDEFRDGNVPGHMRAFEQAVAAFSCLPAQVTDRKMRADVALYSPPLLQWMTKQSIEFAVGAKKRQPLLDACEKVREKDWLLLDRRNDTDLFVTELDYQPRWAKPADKLRYLGVRMRPRQHSLLESDTRKTVYLAIVTNGSRTPAETVRWYWAKAGTVERLHDVVKNELAGGVLPCGRFGANAAWFRLALLTHNILQTLQRAGPPQLRDARPKRLRFQLFSVPATVIRHARSTLAKLADQVRSFTIMTLRSTLWRPRLV